MDLITIDPDNCVNCHRCIAVCPVKLCNDGSSNDHVTLNNEGCIYCGRCVEACEHDARHYNDDFDSFISRPHRELVFIVAPAVTGSWGNNYKKIISFLRSSFKGQKVYDVSFGAELTVMKYEEFIKNNKPKCVIAQPCPTVVKYIEMYKQELIQYLAPVDSPAMATARYLREILGYKGEIAFISPCISKAFEFNDPNTNKYINYNLTHQNIQKYMESKNIELSSLPSSDFDDFQAERAVNFARPGGLKDTVLRDLDIPLKIRKIEGEVVFSEYFEELAKNIQENKPVPLIVDVLNCEKGCCFGPGTLKKLSVDEVDDVINRRIEEQQKKHKGVSNYMKSRAKIIKELEGNKFERKYSRKDYKFSDFRPSESEIEKIYALMNKTKKEDFKNCRHCGYDSCEDMAIAIIAGVNNMSNCMFVVANNLEYQSNHITELTIKITSSIKDINSKVNDIKMIFAEITNSFSLTHDALHNVSASNNKLLGLAEKFKPIVESITEISDQTHLLSVNASIEAARAGEAGSGFAIVAHEVDKLSSQTATEVEKITPMVGDLIKSINAINKRGELVIDDLNSVKSSYATFYEIMENISSQMNMLSNETEKLDEYIEKSKRN